MKNLKDIIILIIVIAIAITVIVVWNLKDVKKMPIRRLQTAQAGVTKLYFFDDDATYICKCIGLYGEDDPYFQITRYKIGDAKGIGSNPYGKKDYNYTPSKRKTYVYEKGGE